jgi:hypothetical protein
MTVSASVFLRQLRSLRKQRMNAPVRVRARGTRRSLSRVERASILTKTGSRCHLCGGSIRPGESWQADHVLANSAGGAHSADNYLPTHALCNNYRWDYLPEEFQLILKLGVWARTAIERDAKFGRELANRFAKHEAHRQSRLRRASV